MVNFIDLRIPLFSRFMGSAPRVRDFHPLGKYTCYKHCLTKIICNFEDFLLLCSRCALLMLGAHIWYTSCGFQSKLQVPSSLARAVTVDNEVSANSRTLHTLNVMHNNKNEVQQIIFPFDHETNLIDSIRIINLNTFRNVEFKRLKNSVYFKIYVPANDIVDLNIFYRQKISETNKYIIASTQSWGEHLKKAVYSLTTERDLKIKSFTYEPDSVKIINSKKVYLWVKQNFMPKNDFEITLND